MSKADETNSVDWLSPAERAFAALAAECAVDPKKFYHQDKGADRARGAMAAHRDLARRYEQFNRS